MDMEVKTCGRCKTEKPVEDFNWKVVDQLRQSYCRHCQSEASRKHYQSNRKRYVAKSVERNKCYRRENEEYIYEYLLMHPCPCGEADPILLEFDHLSDKNDDVSNLLDRPWSRVKREIDKCQVLCVKCHRLKTAKEMNTYRYRRSLLQTTE